MMQEEENPRATKFFKSLRLTRLKCATVQPEDSCFGQALSEFMQQLHS